MEMMHLAALFLLLCHQSTFISSFTSVTHSSRTNNVPHKVVNHHRSHAPTHIGLLNNYSLRSALFVQATPSTNIEKERLDLPPEEAQQSLDYLASLIRTHLNSKKTDGSNGSDTKSAIDEQTIPSDIPNIASDLAKGRFIDLTTNLQSEHILENLFALAPPPSPQIIKYAITSLQSLLVLAMQVGVKGGEEHQKKLVRHLFRRSDPPPPKEVMWASTWTTEDIRRLKFYRDGELGKKVLAALKWKRTAVGAYELLIQMGVWGQDEEVSLLRSGFPIRFLDDELQSSLEVSLMCALINRITVHFNANFIANTHANTTITPTQQS